MAKTTSPAERLVGALSRDRAKDMASDFERLDPAQDYAERRGITFRERVAEIVRKVVPEKVRGMFDGLRLSAEGGQEPERKVAEDPETALRRARAKALIRHARAVDAISRCRNGAARPAPSRWRNCRRPARSSRKYGPMARTMPKPPTRRTRNLPRRRRQAGVNRAVRALQLETELRTDPQRRADRFVDRWRELGQTSQRQYQAGDMAGYKATRSAMGDMAKSLERDPQLESILTNRKRDLGIGIESGRRLGLELAFNHGIDLGRGRGIGL
jgi:hypothetical protein